MKKRVRQFAFLMSMAMFFSNLWSAWGMTVYAAEKPQEVAEATGTSEAAAVKKDKAVDTVSGGIPPKQSAGVKEDGTPIQTIAKRSQIYGKDITFDVRGNWDDKGEFEIALAASEALKNGAYVTMDILLPENASYNGMIKFQGAAKVGDDWTWTEAKNIPELSAGDFNAVSDDYKKVSIQFDFDEKIEKGSLKVFVLKLAGYQCDYSGSIYVENVKLYNGRGQEPLAPVDDSMIDDFESYAEGDNGGWAEEDGWQYEGGVGIAVVSFNGTKTLGLEVDYTGKGDVSWSEAKIAKTFDTPYDVRNYNCLTMDFYFPAEFASNSIKLFSNGWLDKEAVVEVKETLENGYRKAQATVKFTPSDTPMESLTVGFVGKNTSFKDKVYIDNLMLSQYSAAGDYVEITSMPGAGAQANTSGAPSSVKLADKDADASASALYAYLIALRENNQVLFGHENDYNKAVSATANEGDVKEVTGSLSGMYGIDTLSLTGAELGITDAERAVAVAAANSIAAANQGSIITLSAHMPNFTNAKIIQRADGSYDFTTCDFSESKDLSNNCAEQILPGGDYNAQFNAYLDIIADYAKRLQAENIPILFRPFHENNGSWFWWGSGTSVESYKSMFRYAEEYLQASGVHNMLYVYSPNGPFSGEAKYMERYPGDEYIDIIAFDYYDDYNVYPTISDGSFFAGLDSTCALVSSIASARGKVAAISETGVRVMKADGSDNEGLLISNNPVAQSKTGVNWYQKVADIAEANDMPYYLIWANFGDTNFYVPYKYDDTLGHEMINEFIDFYNHEKTIFANGTNFYGQMGSVAVTAYTNPHGYMIAPFEGDVIMNEASLRGSVRNGGTVEFTVTNTETNQNAVLRADRKEGSKVNEYEAVLSDVEMQKLGKTDSAVISLTADGTVVASINNISLGKEKDKAPAHIIDNFEYYAGSNGLLGAAYVENSAAGCNSEFILSSNCKSDGTYGGQFHYILETTGNEVWTGRVKTLENNDYSAYNALTMWVKPDGRGQKVVVQLADDSGEEFEVYLTEFNKSTEAKYVTVPFTSFKGKKGGTLDTSKIMKFAVWCNSIVPEDHTGTWKVDSSIYFDGIQCITASDELMEKMDKYGLIITDESQAPSDDDSGDDDNSNDDKGNNNGGHRGNSESRSSGTQSGTSAAGWNGSIDWPAEGNYLTFNRMSEEKIKRADENGVVIITTLNWMSFHKSVLKAIESRPDVSVTINYKYLGKYYTVTIPAGADASSLANEEGFCGFRYLDEVFGGKEIGKLRETGIKIFATAGSTGNKTE